MQNVELHASLRLASDEILRICGELDRHSGENVEDKFVGRENGSASDELLAFVAKQIYRSRQNRLQYFESVLFGEPVWDILLDLFIAEIEGRRIGVSSASIASHVPATTALRYINFLEEKGLLVRTEAELDKRVSFVSLSSEALESMRQCLSQELVARSYVAVESG